MSKDSGKRAASSPLSPKFDRLGLTDEEVNDLNNNVRDWIQDSPHYALLNAEEVSTRTLALTFQQVAINVLNTARASTVDKSWLKVGDGIERVKLLSREVQLDLASVWVEARDKGSWERFANHPLLQVEIATPEHSGARAYSRNRDDQMEATEKSWEYPFQGNAASGLWGHIKTHFNPSDHRVYAHYAAIVQSSGMGKSRTVDELGKDRLVIPLNLREATSTGYPPADHGVRDYLTTAGSKDVAYDRASAFLEALFKHTTNTLRTLDSSLDYGGLVKKFRSCMTEGQKMTRPNQFREDFYKRVIEKAKQLETRRGESAGLQASPKRAVSHNPLDSTPTRSQDFPPYIAFQELALFLQSALDESPSPSPIRAKAQGKQKAKPRDSDPLVVLPFDEAHTTTKRHRVAGEEWSVYNEIRHALRRLHSLRLFSLFLSTTGKISQFTSANEEDLSKRVVEGKLVVIQPYTDLGFDPLARIITADGSWTLERLTADSQTCSLGRPLFGARYIQGSEPVKREIVQYAVAKLLNTDDPPEELSNDQVLACLSQRFPIEFNSTNYISQEKERKQVEGHMRVYLKIDAAFETMSTTSSSEPILSEAAYFIMQKWSFNAAKALKLVMEGFSISKGDRGEFLVLLVLILARDTTVGPADEFGRPLKGKRWFGLTDFLCGQVFRKQTIPSRFVDANSIRALDMFPKDFPNAQLHCSHFVKVHERKAIDITSLLLLQGRGAAVLCANNQTGIDAINVFLRDGTKLVEGNAGLILHQVKNDSKYSTKPLRKLFDAMDPYDIEILEEGAPALPLIKIVFALAARIASLNVVRHSPTKEYPAVVYEIWCAGISPDILRPIEKQHAGIWDALLQASYGWKELYNAPSDVTADLRRSATPGAARDAGHYVRWAKRR